MNESSVPFLTSGAPTRTKPVDPPKKCWFKMSQNECFVMNFTILKHDKHRLSFISRIFIGFYPFSNKTLAAMFNKTAKGQRHPPIRASLVGHVPAVGVSSTVPLQSGSGVLHLGEVFSPFVCGIRVCVWHTHTNAVILSAGRCWNPDKLKAERHEWKKEKNGENWVKVREMFVLTSICKPNLMFVSCNSFKMSRIPQFRTALNAPCSRCCWFCFLLQKEKFP